MYYTIYRVVKKFPQAARALVFHRLTTYNAAQMKPRTQRPDALGDTLANVLKRVDPEQQLPAYRIWTFWSDEVGEAIAERTQPTRFRNGILFVTVATHAWMQELQFMKESIREKLNARLGTPLVRDLFFVVGRVERPPTAETTRVTPPGSPLVALPEVDDPALAAAFSRIVEARARRITEAKPARPTARRKPAR